MKYLYFDHFSLHLLFLLLKAICECRQTGILVGPLGSEDLALLVANQTLDVFMATSFSVSTADYSTSYFSIRPVTLYLPLGSQSGRSFRRFMTQNIHAINAFPPLELHVQAIQIS